MSAPRSAFLHECAAAYHKLGGAPHQDKHRAEGERSRAAGPGVEQFEVEPALLMMCTSSTGRE